MTKLALIASTAAALALASGAHAADTSAYDWNGFYLGANAGLGWSNGTVDSHMYGEGVRNREVESGIDSGQTGFTAGGLIGYGHQIDRIVLGAEADINYLGLSDSSKRVYDLDGDPLTARADLEADWFGTIRGRLGVTFDNVLVYGTGGAAFGHVNASGKYTLAETPGSEVWKGSSDSTNWGWTLGAGAEYGIDNWRLGVEYLYVDLGDGQWNSNIIGINQAKGNADFAVSTLRATAKYRFQ